MSAEDTPKDYSESPINLEYHYTAGSATTRFLNQVKEGNIVGQGCPKCKAEDQYGDNCEACGATYSPIDLIDPVSVI